MIKYLVSRGLSVEDMLFIIAAQSNDFRILEWNALINLNAYHAPRHIRVLREKPQEHCESPHGGQVPQYDGVRQGRAVEEAPLDVEGEVADGSGDANVHEHAVDEVS